MANSLAPGGCRPTWGKYPAMACLLLALGGLLALLPAVGQDRPARPVRGMVVAVSAPGADVGREILLKGGNAVDAAVATAFAMAVTYPAAGNIGGGGFMLIHPPGKEPVVVEYRETAPAAAHSRMYKPGDSWYTHKAVGVPGTVRGMFLAHSRFGKLPWKDVVLPAVKLAEDGFLLDDTLAHSLNWAASGESEMSRVLGKNGGKERWQAGDRLVQKDLAWSLRLIARDGPDSLLQGPHRRQAGRRDEVGQRPDHQGRPGPLPGPRPQAHSRHLSRL